jgi:hypothetical protein
LATPLQQGKPWTSEPQSLVRRGWFEVVELVFEVVITLIPLVFLAFAGVAARLNGQPQSAWGDQVRRAADLGPTVFPIVFAVIVRRMVLEAARWRAQRGAPLGALDELLGSLSIFGTVETQFFLRSCSVTGVLLFALWALSPVGGQASLRLLSVRPSASAGTRSVWYVAKEQAYNSVFSSLSSWTTGSNNVQALFQASLIAPDAVMDGPEDTWGNVRVPYLEKLDGTAADNEGWIPVPATNVTYSSLLGLLVVPRLQDADDVQTSHFSVETQYYILDCPLLSNTSWNALVNGTIRTTPVCSSDMCGSRFGGSQFGFATNASYWERHPQRQNLPPRDIIWQSWSLAGYTQIFCSLALSHVEANVTCSSRSGSGSAGRRGCGVTQVRQSRRAHPPANYTPLDTENTLRNFFDKWPDMYRHTRAGEHNPTANFLWSGSGTQLPGTPAALALYELPPDVFSKRLTLAWNTLWQASLAPNYHARGLPRNDSAFAAAAASGSDGQATPAGQADPSKISLRRGSLYVNATTATTTRATPRYVCARHWLGLLIVASLALLVSAVLGLVAKYTTIAPDIIGKASSLTRDSRFFALPAGGNTLDGMERARALKRVRVRLQDVQPDAPVGHIALALDDAALKGDAADVEAATASSSSVQHGSPSLTAASRLAASYPQNGRLYA